MEKAIKKQWEDDEKNKLEVGTPVRIDLSWFYDAYGYYPLGHGLHGEVVDAWKDVDGFYLYDVGVGLECGGIEVAFSRKDLRCL